MESGLPSFIVEAQYLVAGWLLLLAIDHLLGWRRHRRDRRSWWFGCWALTLSACLLSNVWVFEAGHGQLAAALLVRGFLITAAIMLVLLPTVAAFAGVRTPQRGLALVAGLGALRLALWAWTDAVFTHRVTASGVPIYGPLTAVTAIVPVAICIALIVRMSRRWADRVERAIFGVALAISVAIACASEATNNTIISEVMAGYWILPAALGLQLISTRQTRLAERAEQDLVCTLARTERRSRLALQSGGMGWFEYRPHSGAFDYSPELADLLGTEWEALSFDEVFSAVHPADRRFVLDSLAATTATGAGWAEYRCLHVSGRTVWLESNARSLVDEDGNTEIIGMVKDITERKQAEAERSFRDRHDPLTGLGNRLALAEAVEAALASGMAFTLVLLDLDRFKDVNDTLGHPVGDQVLMAVAARLSGAFPGTTTLARLGGDEFALVSRAQPEETAQRLLTALGPPVTVDGVSINARASLGMVRAPVHGGDPDTLLRRADAAMYMAKANRGSWHLHNGEDEREAAVRLGLAGDLPEAIAESQIEVHYQPTLHISTSRVHVLEALVRWRHPERGMIGPTEFVPLAETYGLGRALFERVLRDALAQCALWRRHRLASAVSVNVSAPTLTEPGFVDLVQAALATAGLGAHTLVLELTENIFAEESTALLVSLSRLRELGVRLAIDDFGTGYSSLAYLSRLPVQIVKLDRVFTAGLGTDSANDAIVTSTIDLAHRLGMTVVAEGVEARGAFDALSAYGCDGVQGFAIQAPAAGPETINWLTERAARSGSLMRIRRSL